VLARRERRRHADDVDVAPGTANARAGESGEDIEAEDDGVREDDA
jgi:hypothetical protein